IGELESDPRWKLLPGHINTHRSALAVPLVTNEDSLGAMILFSPEPNAFDEDQLRLVAAAANQVAAAINNAELYRLIRDQAERLGGMLRGQQVEATKSRAILEGIADGVLVADAEGDVILFNVACEHILGLARDAVVGRPVNEFVGIYGAGGQNWTQAIDRWRYEPNNYRPGEFVAQRLQLDNERVISVHLAPVIASEDYLGSVSVIRDVTREVEVDRLKSEFVTNVSHELRTPMTSIKGYADLLLLGAAGQLSGDQARFLEIIKNNADRLSLLVNDLLDISRIESGKVQLVMRPTSIGEVINDVVLTLEGQIKDQAKPMTLVADAPRSLPPAWGDRERITEIIMNLAENAFAYSQAGGQITLHAEYDEARRQILVEVTDSGIGIDLVDQPRIFDRFYRGEDALVLGSSGTGLGLPIARQLAEMHGGRLWLAHSEAGHGSTFALSLPTTGAQTS
ncbi:MAG: ATP-binding protein, partial [Anaerolineales bacterium]